MVPHDSKSDLPLGMSTGRLSSTPGIIYTLSKLGGVLWQEIEGNYVTWVSLRKGWKGEKFAVETHLENL